MIYSIPSCPCHVICTSISPAMAFIAHLLEFLAAYLPPRYNTSIPLTLTLLPLYIPHLTSFDKLPDELIPSQLSRSNSGIFSVNQLPFLPDIQTLTLTLTLTFTLTFTISFTFNHCYLPPHLYIDYLLPLLPSTPPSNRLNFPLLPSITPCNITSVYLDLYPRVTFTYALRLPITSNHCPNGQSCISVMYHVHSVPVCTDPIPSKPCIITHNNTCSSMRLVAFLFGTLLICAQVPQHIKHENPLLKLSTLRIYRDTSKAELFTYLFT